MQIPLSALHFCNHKGDKLQKSPLKNGCAKASNLNDLRCVNIKARLVQKTFNFNDFTRWVLFPFYLKQFFFQTA